MREFRPIILLLLLFVGGVLCLPQVAVATTRYVAVTGDGGSNFNAGSTATTPTIAATACTVSGTNIAAASGTPFSGLSGGEYISVYQNGTDTALKAIGVISAVNNGGADVDITAWLLGTPDEDEDRCIVGGAWADPGYAASKLADDDILYIKSGTYQLATTTPGAGGPIVPGTDRTLHILGYESTPGDDCPTGDRPIIDANSQAVTNVMLLDNTLTEVMVVKNIEIDGSGTATYCFQFDNYVNGQTTVGENCVAHDAVSDGFYKGLLRQCLAYDNGRYGIKECHAIGCVSRSNANYGFYGCVFLSNSIACYNKSGGGVYAGAYGLNSGVVSYKNAGNGFYGAFTVHYLNCISVSNSAGYGFREAYANERIIDSATYGNSSGATRGVCFTEGLVSLSGVPFLSVDNDDPDDDDFRLDATYGASIKGAGFAVYGQIDNRDIGAVQHADPAGGGGETSHVWVR